MNLKARTQRNYVRTDGHGIHHGCDFSNSPAHDKSASAEVLLERCTEHYKSNNVQANSQVAGPFEKDVNRTIEA